MTTKIFAYFPEKDDNFILDLSINKQNIDAFVSEFAKMFEEINDKKAKIYYDVENIKGFLQKINEISEDKFYLEDMEFQLLELLGKNTINLQENSHSKKTMDSFVLWNYENFSVECPCFFIQEMTEVISKFPEEKYLLINTKNDFETKNRNFLTIFKDNFQNADLPNQFVKIPFVVDFEELCLWFLTNYAQNFSLLDKIKFRRTKFVQQGKPVFEEINTGYYWYLDNLHKNEYEVFNAQKEHIGVADLQGNIDASQKINGREF